MQQQESMFDLLKIYPTMSWPIRCENGCGAVIDLGDAYRSYKRSKSQERKLICACCASEEGHADEIYERPNRSPVCHRKPKKRLQ